MHKKANQYKYQVEEKRTGVWNDPDRFYDPKEYWHLILKLNRDCDTSSEVYEEIKDLEELFGDVSKRSLQQANTEMFADSVKGCFSVLVFQRRGVWYIDLHLKEEFVGEIDII